MSENTQQAAPEVQPTKAPEVAPVPPAPVVPPLMGNGEKSPTPPAPTIPDAPSSPDFAAQFEALKAEIEALKAEKDGKIKELGTQVKNLEADRMAQKEAKRREILGSLNPIFDDVYGWAPDAKTADPDTPEGIKALKEWAASKKELFRGSIAPQPTVTNNGDKRTFAQRLEGIFNNQPRRNFEGLGS